MGNAWDREYERGGIPSSYRVEPSGALRWALANWRLVTGGAAPRTALDAGCGTGRNAAYMASLGTRVLAFDNSAAALKIARRQDSSVLLLRHDLREGIPARDAAFDFIADIFVYKHLLEAAERAAYRGELARVLCTDGRLLLSLAERSDEYYGGCPVLDAGHRLAVMDPHTGIGSVLFSLEELKEELNDRFELEMSWHKEKPGLMHGRTYLRRTLATLWRLPVGLR